MAIPVAKRILKFTLGALATIAVVLAAMFLGAFYETHSAHGTTVTCPVTGAGQWQRCILVKPSHVGQQITDQKECFGTTPWMITDYLGAPEAWMRCGSLYIGAVPGWLGGQICFSDLKTNTCLTEADIRWIHAHE